MKPRVLASWEEPNGISCVDILAHEDGTFGYVLCRRDPEDGHGWRQVSDPEGPRFDKRSAAEAAAAEMGAWDRT